MAGLTVLYITEDTIEPEVRDFSLKYLFSAIGDLPLVSSTQRPMDIGKNVTIKEQGHSGLLMYKQIARGLEVIDTEFVAIAEHDCLYPAEHFAFRPPDKRYWYNTNCWLVQTPNSNPKHPEYDGMFSIFPGRRVQSQLICNTDEFRQVVKDQIAIVEDPAWKSLRYNRPVGEPGTVDYAKFKLATKGYTGLLAKMKDFMINYNAADFETKIPTIDIRHKNNFTGPRRGKRRTYELPYWGSWEDVKRANGIL